MKGIATGFFSLLLERFYICNTHGEVACVAKEAGDPNGVPNLQVS